jgi:hypothetical protein
VRIFLHEIGVTVLVQAQRTRDDVGIPVTQQKYGVSGGRIEQLEW